MGTVPSPLRVRDILTAMIRAHEIQGVLALENSFNRVGLDHVLLVRVASTAIVAGMLGLKQPQIIDAVSNAWIDGGALRTYRHAPNTGPRKSWAAGDAASRAVWLALLTRAGEPGYATALTAQTWGFQDSLFRGQMIKLARPLGSYVMENILFKVAFPAEFHGQTAVEAALRLHPQLRGRLDDIVRVTIETHESAMRIIDKRSIANAMQIEFRDGSRSERVEIEYPLGHRRRRDEARPLLFEKFKANAATRLTSERVQRVIEWFEDPARLDATSVTDFVGAFSVR